MSRIEIRGVIVPSNYDLEWMRPYIEKGVVTPESYVRKQIASSDTKKPLELYINSPGGSVFAAYELINTLAAWRMDNGQPVNITIGAMAASAASAIAILSGANLKAFRNSKLMFHGAWTDTVGGAEAHKDTAALLEQINADIKAALVGKYGIPVETVDQWFAEGRQGWINASEAKQYGMVSEIVDNDDEEIKFVEGDIAGIEANGLAIASLFTAKEPEAVVAPVFEVKADAQPAEAVVVEVQDDGGKPADENEAGASVPATEPAADVAAEPAATVVEPPPAGAVSEPAAEEDKPEPVAIPVDEQVEIALQERLADHKKNFDELSAKYEQTEAQRAHFQSCFDKEQEARKKDKHEFEMRLSAMADALKQANARLTKLTLGSLTFSPVIETWPEALASCNGDYALARKQHPDAYAQFMQTKTKRN